MRPLLTGATACLLLGVHLPAASADEPEQGSEEPPVELQFEGYGDLLFSFYDFGPDRTRDGGS